MRYVLHEPIVYYSKRYNKWITVPFGFFSDGATGAVDIKSKAWWIHDFLLMYKSFDDGTTCTWQQANLIMHDVLKEEGRWFRCWSWLYTCNVYQWIKHL